MSERVSVTVVAALVVGGGDRVFLARRSEAAGHGGLWELPGGKVEPGERAEEAIVREIREELGVGLLVEGPPSRYEASIGEKDFRFLVFPAHFASWDFRLSAHDEWGYFPAAALGELELAPLDGPALEDWAAKGASVAAKGDADGAARAAASQKE